jgi:hypothetical protein
MQGNEFEAEGVIIRVVLWLLRLTRSYRRILGTCGSGGSCLRLRFDDLNSVVELYSQDDFRQEAVAFDGASSFRQLARA